VPGQKAAACQSGAYEQLKWLEAPHKIELRVEKRRVKVRFRPTGWISIAELIIDRPVANMGHLVDLSVVAALSATMVGLLHKKLPASSA
jgi:hypothetical protein